MTLTSMKNNFIKKFFLCVMFLPDCELYKYKQSGNTEKGLNKMKKLIVIIMLVVAMVTLSACGNSSPTSDMSETPSTPSDSGTQDSGAPPAGGYWDSEQDFSYDGEKYLDIVEGGKIYTDEDAKATFSLKVDTAAFTNVQRYINDGMLPPVNAVRTEELINYFNYEGHAERVGNSPFSLYTEVGPSPFDADKELAFIRVKTDEIDKEELPPSNLVFLIDTSGSMDSYDKLPLLQDSFSMLVDTLDENDRVSIVTYAGNSSIIARGVSGDSKNKLNAAIYDLYAGGSTAGAKGIHTAYEIAKTCFIKGGNNRVILATDGDFNVGISDIDSLSKFISEKRSDGIYLSVLGFGTGNIRDDIMETLAKDGNGNYSYIDTKQTAKKVLVNELGANMFTVADDVKAQIEFNPDTVKSFRLIGYENRVMNHEDFTDDRKDAGEIGAGADVIVLFEIDVVGSSGKLFDVNIRYKDPGENESKALSVPVSVNDILAENTTDYYFASTVAVFGDMLRNPDTVSGEQVEKLISKTKANLGKDRDGYRADYLNLLYSYGSQYDVVNATRSYWDD